LKSTLTGQAYQCGVGRKGLGRLTHKYCFSTSKPVVYSSAQNIKEKTLTADFDWVERTFKHSPGPLNNLHAFALHNLPLFPPPRNPYRFLYDFTLKTFLLEKGKRHLPIHQEGGKMNRRIYSGLAIAAVCAVFMIVSSGSCLAQEQGRGGGPTWMSAGDDMPKAFIEAEDKDKDGKVSNDEFGGPDTLFEQWDKNSDGFIELSEAPTADSLQGMMGGRGEGGGPGGAPPEGGAPGGAPAGN
jgi:hypothetical protein